jgi:hypothetical protein
MRRSATASLACILVPTAAAAGMALMVPMTVVGDHRAGWVAPDFSQYQQIATSDFWRYACSGWWHADLG